LPTNWNLNDGDKINPLLWYKSRSIQKGGNSLEFLEPHLENLMKKNYSRELQTYRKPKMLVKRTKVGGNGIFLKDIDHLEIELL